jgi:hypothetical protein
MPLGMAVPLVVLGVIIVVGVVGYLIDRVAGREERR